MNYQLSPFGVYSQEIISQQTTKTIAHMQQLISVELRSAPCLLTHTKVLIYESVRCNKEIVSSCKNLEKFLVEVYSTHNYNLKRSLPSFLHECVSDKKCIHIIRETCQSEFIRFNTNQYVFQYKYNMDQLQRERWWRNVQPSLARSIAGTGCVWVLTGPILLDVNKN